MSRQHSNVTTVRNNGSDRAVVFLHGFSGARDDTWDRFPGLVGSGVPEWDVFTVGYATTLLPDVVGIWSADPDLPILATLLRTQLAIPPFGRYASIALIAHSMGGLVAQQALVDDATLPARVRHVILFGTPSGGLRKARWAQFWKRQLTNMAEGSSFIRELRQAWQERYASTPPFDFVVVAGASDQFVPPTSSLGPFDKAIHQVVAGDHVSIVKPAAPDAPSVSLVVARLRQGQAPARDAAAEPAALAVGSSTRLMAARDVVDAALALERSNRRGDAVALLEQHKERDTDIKGTLAGRFKRMWMESENPEDGARALSLYQEAHAAAATPDQIAYLAINVAFMRLAFAADAEGARAMATRALEHASPPGDDVWKTGTVAEAHLYLNRIADGLAEYRRLLTLDGEAWKHQSAALQAARIAGARGDRGLAEALEAIFTPGARRASRIVLHYHHKDLDWVTRLQAMAAPFLRNAESELDLWDDMRLAAGQRDIGMRDALARSSVVVALVSANFLSARSVVEHELPMMVTAARTGDLRLLWTYVSSAGWEETALTQFQPTHDTALPLDARPHAEQNEALKSIARQMKEAALEATGRFNHLADERGAGHAASR